MPNQNRNNGQNTNSPAPESAWVPTTIGKLARQLHVVLGGRYQRVSELTFATLQVEQAVNFATLRELARNAPSV